MKKNLYLILGVTTVIALGGAWLYISLFFSLSQMRDERGVLMSSFKDGARILKEEQSNKTKLSGYFVKQGDEASFISSVETACKKISLVCSLGSLDETAGAGNIKNFHATVTAKGSFENIMKLQKAFENSTYPIQILKVSFDYAENTMTVIAPVSTSTTSQKTGEWTSITNIDVPVISTQ